MATVYAVASSKGGVGKTTTTVNLGATLASAGLSVAVVDGDIGMANLGDALGIEPDGATLHDVLAEDSEVETEDAIYDGPEGLAVVPGDTSIDGFRSADPANLGRVLDALDDYDYVLVDTGAGLSHDTVLPLGLADEVVLVSTTERDSLTDTEKTRQVVDRLGGTTRGVVLTRVDPDDPNAEEVAERLSADVIEAIPVDPVVGESMRLADPLPSYAPGSPAASAYRALAGSLTGESIPTPDVVEAEDEADDTVEASAVEADTAEPDEADEVDADEAGEDEADADDADAVDADADESDDAETAGADEEAETVEDDDGITLDAPDDDEDDDGITLTEPEDTPEDPDETDVAETGATEDESTDDSEDADGDSVAVDAGESETVEAEVDDSETGDDSEESETADDAGDPSGLTDDDDIAADTSPSDDPLVADSAEPADDDSEAEDAEDTVFTTSLVEEAEPTDEEGSEETSDGESDAEFVETDEKDDDDDGGKGFLGRLLG